MKFGFEEAQTKYSSGSQRARIWTEQWVSRWIYCPNCANSRLSQFPANLPVADFLCGNCNDQFELKSQRKAFGAKVADGAYFTKIERLASSTNPNLILLNYSLGTMAVLNVCMVPKHFFIPEIIEKRNPLASKSRLDRLQHIAWSRTAIGAICIVRDGVPVPKETVIAQWQKTLFLREEDADARGWLIEVMKCLDLIGTVEFDIEQVYAFEGRLGALYPHNMNVRPKIRQQLQRLRDSGYLDFISRGRYRIGSSRP